MVHSSDGCDLLRANICQRATARTELMLAPDHPPWLAVQATAVVERSRGQDFAGVTGMGAKVSALSTNENDTVYYYT